MDASHSRASTARLSPSASVHSHGRSHSLSDPRSYASPQTLPSTPSASTLEFYNEQPAVLIWQHANASSSLSAHPSPNPSTNSSTIVDVDTQSHVARRATSPQSMVSSGSPKCDSPAALSSSNDTGESPSSSRATGKKRSIDRNRKPCGACSSSKRKCKLIPNVPNLCERCRNHGMTECPPHISWTTRKQSVADSGSPSPLDVDDSTFSSRSASPSYYGAGRSPVGYPAVFQNPNEHGVYADVTTTQEWVQAQTQAQAPSQGSTSSVDLGTYETFYTAHEQQPGQAPNAASLYFPQQGSQTNTGLSPPALPVCHVCHTPYNAYLMLNYAQAQLSATMPSPPYELDQALLKMYGHIPPRDARYENPY